MSTGQHTAAIRVDSPSGGRSTHRLPIGSSQVGRDRAAGVPIVSDYVSWHHAEIYWDGEQLSIRDLDSRNGTWVNGQPVTGWIDLDDRDVIRFGTVQGVVEAPGIVAQRPQASPQGRSQTPLGEPPTTSPVEAPSVSQVPIFVSHSSEDKASAREISRYLKRQGWSVWIDEVGIAGGKEWHGELIRALEAAWIVLLVVSLNSMRSRWVIREIQAADRLGLRVIPVMVDEAPYPDELRMILSGVQQLPLTERDPADRNQQLSRLDHALVLGARARRTTRPGKVLIAVGSSILTIGLIGFVLGFALFAYLGFTEVNTRSAGDGIPRPFIGWGICAASIVVAGIGEAMRKAGLKKGI